MMLARVLHLVLLCQCGTVDGVRLSVSDDATLEDCTTREATVLRVILEKLKVADLEMDSDWPDVPLY